MKRPNEWRVERAHRAMYCAQRDLLMRLYVTGLLDYETTAAWVLAVRGELDLNLAALRVSTGG